MLPLTTPSLLHLFLDNDSTVQMHAISAPPPCFPSGPPCLPVLPPAQLHVNSGSKKCDLCDDRAAGLKLEVVDAGTAMREVVERGRRERTTCRDMQVGRLKKVFDGWPRGRMKPSDSAGDERSLTEPSVPILVALLLALPCYIY